MSANLELLFILLIFAHMYVAVFNFTRQICQTIDNYLDSDSYVFLLEQ